MSLRFRISGDETARSAVRALPIRGARRSLGTARALAAAANSRRARSSSPSRSGTSYASSSFRLKKTRPPWRNGRLMRISILRTSPGSWSLAAGSSRTVARRPDAPGRQYLVPAPHVARGVLAFLVRHDYSSHPSPRAHAHQRPRGGESFAGCGALRVLPRRAANLRIPTPASACWRTLFGDFAV